jgi:hypothetical protein
MKLYLSKKKSKKHTMENLIGKWGWVSIDEVKTENFKKYIHPESINILSSCELTDFVFQCIGILSNNFIILKSTEIEICIMREVFRIMPKEPDFYPNERVSVFNSKGILEHGIVKSIDWNNKESMHIYLIEVGGKIKSRRYSSKDLMKKQDS